MDTRSSRHQRVSWYRVPVVWLGALIFAGSLAGCVWIIVASTHYRDEALDIPVHSVLGVPAHSRPAKASP